MSDKQSRAFGKGWDPRWRWIVKLFLAYKREQKLVRRRRPF